MIKSLRFVFIFITFQFFCYFSFAQCGVTAGMNFMAGAPPDATFDAGIPYSSFQPNWVPYKYEWEINNQVQTNPFGSQSASLAYGIGLIKVTVFARDTTTGDSCSSSYSNVYRSIGYELFVWFEITSINGNTFNFDAGGVGESYPPYIMDYGDGTADTTQFGFGFFSHTYSTSGDYLVTYSANSILGSNPVSTSQRKVHVANGFSNITTVNKSDGLICDSAIFNISTTPPFNYGYYIDVPGTFFPFPNITNAVNFSKKFEVPGFNVIRAVVHDSSFQSYDQDIYMWESVQGACIIPDTVSGHIYSDTDADGIHDANEPPIANVKVYANDPFYLSGTGYYVETDSSGYYSIVVPHQPVYLSLLPPQLNGYIQTSGINNVSYNTSTMHPGQDFELAPIVITVQGYTYLDYNQDSLFNGTDGPLKSATLQAFNANSGFSYYTSSGLYGQYKFELPGGNYTFKVAGSYIDSATIVPDSIVVNSTGGYFSGKNFGFNSTLAGGNLGVNGGATSNERPGFPYSLSFNIRNTGIDTVQGELIVHYDPLLLYDTLYPSNGAVDQINHTIIWQTGNIAPTDFKNYTGQFTIPASASIGTLLSSYATITTNVGYTDHDLTNNADTIKSVLVGSFDPNDKSVSPMGYGANGNVLHNQRLHYRINFQNTGTASAINIIVQDSITPNLDMNTFMMERSSHYYIMNSSGRIITWRFPNIYLPDSNSNEQLSHGFIEYSIMPIQGLPDGSIVDNTANIYFDFNSPVATNTVVNTLQTNITGIESAANKNEITVYPVPVKDILLFQLNERYKTPFEIKLSDITGRIIKKMIVSETPKNNRLSMDLKSVSKGVYLVQVNSMVVKIVKE